jgi:hypothetical protein
MRDLRQDRNGRQADRNSELTPLMKKPARRSGRPGEASLALGSSGLFLRSNFIGVSACTGVAALRADEVIE